MGQTKLRTTQMSGSMSDLVYSGSRTSAARADQLTAANVPHLGAVLGQFAGAIGRITGKTGTGTGGFTNNAEGVFAPSKFDVDTVGALTFDGADDSNLTVTGAAKDLDIAVAGGGAQKLSMSSAGTGADAIHLNASAGGIDIDSADMIDIDAADEITIDTTSADGHISITSAHTAGVAMSISAAAASDSELDIAAGILDIDVTGAATIDASSLTVTSDTNTFTSANSADPLVVIKNTNNDANGARLQLVKDKGAAGAANDLNGQIDFIGDDANQDQVTFSQIKSQVAVATDGQEGGKFTISVAEHDGTLTAGLVITDGNADGELDVVIGAGSASLTSVSGDMTVAGNLTINGVTTQVDTTNLQVKDKNILINDGGSTAGTTGAGIDIEGDSAAVVGYIKVHDSNNDKFVLKAPGDASVLTLDTNGNAEFTIAGDLGVESASLINQDLTTDSTSAQFATGSVDVLKSGAVARGLRLHMDGNTGTNKIVLKPALADAFTIGRSGNEPYLRFTSTAGQENIQLHKLTAIVDTQKFRVGSGTGATADLELLHDGTDSSITNHTGLFTVASSVAGASLMLSASHRGAVELQSGGEIFVIDSNFSGSVTDPRGLALTSKGGSEGTGKDEINQYVRNFGQASLIKAINSAFYASGSGGDPSRTVKTLAADVAANGRAFGAGNGFSTAGISEADIDKALTVYVNGQLLLSGSSADYVLNQASGRADTDIACKFELQINDVIQAIVKP